MRTLILLAITAGAMSAAEPPTIPVDVRTKAVEELTKEAARYAKLKGFEKDWATQLAQKKDASLAEKLKNLRAELKELRTDKPEDFARPLTLTGAGEVGRLPYPRCRVDEVIDKQSAILQTRTRPNGPQKNEPVFVIVSAPDTSTWADGAAIDAPPGLYHVTTQKRGTRTYFHLAPLVLTKDEAEAVMKAAKP